MARRASNPRPDYSSARRRGIGVVLTVVAVGLVVAACGSTSPSSDSGAADTPTTTGSAVAVDLADKRLSVLCEKSFAVPSIDLDAAVGMPLPDGIADETELGPEGAAEIVSEIGPAVPNLCTLDVSPAVASAIAEIEDAARAGDSDEVSRLLDQLISSDIQAWAPMSVGVSADEGVDHEQRTRDYMEAAETAAENGDSEAANDAYNEAAAEYSEYVKETVGNTTDPQKLMDMAETSAFFGNDEDMAELLEKLLDHFEKELAPVLESYEPCTADAVQTGELVDATARVLILGGEADDALQAIMERQDIWERRQLGEAIPECDSFSFFQESPLGSQWDGTTSIDLLTCDGVTWTGTLFAEGVLDMGQGRMSFTYATPVSVVLPDPTGEASVDIEIPVNISIQSAAGTGTVSGTTKAMVTLTVDAKAMTATATVARQAMPGKITITVEGQTVTMPFTMDASTSSLSGPIEQQDPCP